MCLCGSKREDQVKVKVLGKQKPSVTSIRFVNQGLIETTEKQVNVFDDPDKGLSALISCIFYKRLQEDLIDKALALLRYLKREGSLSFEKGALKDNPDITIDDMILTYSNYSTIVKHLKNAGLVYGKKGSEIRLSKRFCNFMDSASKCWHRFYVSK